MKKYLFSFISVLVFLPLAIMAQGEDPVVMTINGKDVKKSEFEYIYNKNNSENAIDKKTFEEYVTLFKNFKLKVAEAETQGLDTTAAFHKELNEYRSQLAKPYLTSSEIDETLLKEGYEKRKNLREVTNLLILYPEAKNTRSAVIFPSDTLEIYNRAMQIRKRYLAGEKWENLVVENTDDERYKQGDRPGYIGWVSGLRLPVPLAKGIYDTPVGQISLPVRTSYGYHLLVVLAEKPDPGDVHAAHILIPIPGVIDSVSVAEALSKVDTVYTQLKEGVAFEEVAKKYSGDTSSAVRGGDLSWFGVGMMVPEFNDAVFALKEAGDISEPVKTQFGYHIIKLLEKRPPASYEDRKNDLKNNYERSGYSYFLNQPDIEKLKKDNGFSFNENAYKLLYNDAQTLFPTDSLFLDKWKGNNEILYVTGNQPYSIGNFIEYLGQNKRTVFSLSTEVLDELVKNYEYKLLQQAEDQTLEGKYPEFKNLMQEYHDGILLFEVSNKEVWEKSAADTLGLTSFFEKNKDKYAWDKPHYKGYVILAKDSKTKKKMQKEIAKLNVDTAAQYLLDHYKGEEAPLVKIEKGLFIQGENPFVDQIIFKSAKATLPEGFSDFFVTGKLLPELPEAYTDVRGLVITDYQDYLEKEWLESLNKKYSVTIHQNVLNTVK